MLTDINLSGTMGSLVSIVIPSYGRADFLTNGIASIDIQTYPDIEVIIVDDNGRDSQFQQETEKVIAEAQCRFPIRYLIHATNRGGAAARNTGARSANGKFIAFLDNDDECTAERIAKQVSLLEDRNAVDDSIQASLCLPIKKKRRIEISRESEKHKSNYQFELLSLAVDLSSGSSILIYADAYFKLSGFDERFVRNQDLEFMVRFYDIFNAVILNEHLVVINIDDRSNIPSFEKIKATKRMFLDKFETIIRKFPPNSQRVIYKSHALEIAKVALWNKNLSGFFSVFLNAGLSWKESFLFLAEVVKKSLVHLK